MGKRIFLLIALLVTVACGSKLEPANLEVTEIDRETVSVPKGCEKHYQKNERYVVAVVEFFNNTTYTNATVTGGSSSSAAAVGVVSTGNAIGAAGVSATNFEVVTKDISPKLGEYAQGSVEAAIIERGGADVVSRTRLDSILKEQKFQMTLADTNTAVEFGRLAGAQYIITGSVDNIGVQYKDASNLSSNQGGFLGLVLAAVDVVSNLDAGWNIETELTVNIIEVSTGKILGTKRSKGYANVGNSPMFSSDQVIAGAKKAMGESIKESVTMIVAEFPIKGYVNELRGGKQAALISIGSLDGVREGDKLSLFELVSRTDFRTNKTECALNRLPFDVTVSSHIDTGSAWAQVNTTDEKLLQMLKVGTVVQRLK